MACARPIQWRLLLGAVATLAVLYLGFAGLRILYPIGYLDLIRASADEYGLDLALVGSLVRAESRFRADAVSPRGAVGLMQIMPDTGAWIAARIGLAAYTPEQLFDPATNLRLGCWYLRHMLDRFPNLEQALWAYNAGATRVDEWLAAGQSPFPETSAYVRRVLRAVSIYRLYLRWSFLVRVTPSSPL